MNREQLLEMLSGIEGEELTVTIEVPPGTPVASSRGALRRLRSWNPDDPRNSSLLWFLEDDDVECFVLTRRRRFPLPRDTTVGEFYIASSGFIDATWEGDGDLKVGTITVRFSDARLSIYRG